MKNSNFPASQPAGRGCTTTLSRAMILSTAAIFIRCLTRTCRTPALILAFWRDVFLIVTLTTILGCLPSSQANLIVTTELVFTTVIVYLLLGKRLSGAQVSGSLDILLAMFLLQRQDGRLPNRTRLHYLHQGEMNA